MHWAARSHWSRQIPLEPPDPTCVGTLRQGTSEPQLQELPSPLTTQSSDLMLPQNLPSLASDLILQDIPIDEF